MVLEKSLISNLPDRMLGNIAYINAKEYLQETVVKFFHNGGEDFPVDEYKLIVNEFLLQMMHDQRAIARERSISFPPFPTGDKDEEEINAVVQQLRERAPDMADKLKQLNEYAANFTVFEDQLSLSQRILNVSRNVFSLLPSRRINAEFYRSRCRRVGALALWLQHWNFLTTWDGVGELGAQYTLHFDHLSSFREFAEYDA